MKYLIMFSVPLQACLKVCKNALIIVLFDLVFLEAHLLFLLSLRKFVPINHSSQAPPTTAACARLTGIRAVCVKMANISIAGT